jgi:hypothetical protein
MAAAQLLGNFAADISGVLERNIYDRRAATLFLNIKNEDCEQNVGIWNVICSKKHSEGLGSVRIFGCYTFVTTQT